MRICVANAHRMPPSSAIQQFTGGSYQLRSGYSRAEIGLFATLMAFFEHVAFSNDPGIASEPNTNSCSNPLETSECHVVMATKRSLSKRSETGPYVFSSA